MVCKARSGIKEVHFLPFNPTDKRTALTYIDANGNMHRVSKGAPEQVVYIIHSHFLRTITFVYSLFNFSDILCRFSILHITKQKLDGEFMQLLTSSQNVDFDHLESRNRFNSFS